MELSDKASRANDSVPESALLAWGSALTLGDKLSDAVWQAHQHERRFVLKRRPDTFNPDLEVTIFNVLSARNVPVVLPIVTSTGHQAHRGHGYLWSLYPFVEGYAVSLATITTSEAHELGAVLAELHNALDSYSEKLSALHISGEPHNCSRGTIHRDFHPGNIILAEGRIRAIVDFDLVCKGPRAFDLAYLGASLLASSWHDASLRHRFVPVFTAIVEGYHFKRYLSHTDSITIPLLLEEVERMFITLGRETANELMESSAREVLQWFVQQRAAITTALSEVVSASSLAK